MPGTIILCSSLQGAFELHGTLWSIFYSFFWVTEMNHYTAKKASEEEDARSSFEIFAQTGVVVSDF